jgi:hypothetical protein
LLPAIAPPQKNSTSATTNYYESCNDMTNALSSWRAIAERELERRAILQEWFSRN